MGADLRSHCQGHWERKCKNRFSRTSLHEADRFTPYQGRNDHRLVLHMSSNTFHQPNRVLQR